MLIAISAALLLHSHAAKQQNFHSGMLWEETAVEQKMPGYHPRLRFNTPSTMIRFSPSTNYMFVTPDFIQQGQFQVQGSYYGFRAVSAFELENADIAKIAQDMDPQEAKNLRDSYARSMANFEGEYDVHNKTLTISYPVKGIRRSYHLHMTTEGDDQLPMTVSSPASNLIGLWQAPEPFPDKLDARTRVKIELDGLQRFSKEAMASNSAIFTLLDLRQDGTFRSFKTIGMWARTGGTLILKAEGHETRFSISADGSKLLSGGKPAFVRS